MPLPLPSPSSLQVTAGSLFGVPASGVSSTVAKPAPPKALSTGTLAAYGTSGLPDTATQGVDSVFAYACTGDIIFAVYDGGKLTLSPAPTDGNLCTFAAIDMAVSGDLAARSICSTSAPQAEPQSLVCLQAPQQHSRTVMCPVL